MTKPENNAERVSRERDFHNTRFTEESRTAQQKYYFAISHGTKSYHAQVQRLVSGADVLEYGCARGQNVARWASHAKSITGIDISDVAVSDARAAAAKTGLTNTAFHVMDAENLEFENQSFDTIFGSGIVHHLNVKRCYEEVARVLRVEGTAVFWEPLGHNPIMNLYRQMTPTARTVDEHPLKRRDVLLAHRYFNKVSIEFYGLLTLAAVPLRNKSLGRQVFKVAAVLDRLLLLLPGIKWWAWHALIRLTK